MKFIIKLYFSKFKNKKTFQIWVNFTLIGLEMIRNKVIFIYI